MNGQTLDLRLAGTDFRLTGIPDGWLGSLPDRLMLHRISPSRATAGASLSIELCPDEDSLVPPPQGHDLNECSRLSYGQSAISYSSDWCRGNLRPASPLQMSLECHSGAGPWFGGLLENALRTMVAYDVLRRGGLLLHSAAIVIRGQAHVCIGHSGAGKSTTSRIAMDNGYQVISDDINALLPHKEGWRAIRVPFCGSVGGSHDAATSVPVAAIYDLVQDRDTMLQALTTATAVSVICGSAPFINQDPERTDRLLDNATRLAGERPVWKLYFRPDAEFLELLAKDGIDD